jgi:hypothetical protein
VRDAIERTYATLPTSMAFRRRSGSYWSGIRLKAMRCGCWAGCIVMARSKSSWSCRMGLAA